MEDFRRGYIRSAHQLDSVKEEAERWLSVDQVSRGAFPQEINAVLLSLQQLYAGVSGSPTDCYSQLKNRQTECRRAAMAARRLHHRSLRRRISEQDMTWTGAGGLVASALLTESLVDTPNYAKLDRLVVQFLLDCLYKGYDVDYLRAC